MIRKHLTVTVSEVENGVEHPLYNVMQSAKDDCIILEALLHGKVTVSKKDLLSAIEVVEAFYKAEPVAQIAAPTPEKPIGTEQGLIMEFNPGEL